MPVFNSLVVPGSFGKPKTLQIPIPASGWDASAKTQTVTATGVTATNAVTPSPHRPAGKRQEPPECAVPHRPQTVLPSHVPKFRPLT